MSEDIFCPEFISFHKDSC